MPSTLSLLGGGVSGGWWIIAGGRGFEGLERRGGEGRGDYHSCGRVWMWPNSGSLWFQSGHGHRGTHMHGHLGTLERGPTLNQTMTTGRGVRE